MNFKKYSVLGLIGILVILSTGCSKISTILSKKPKTNVELEAAQELVDSYKKEVSAKNDEIEYLKKVVDQMQKDIDRLESQKEIHEVEKDMDEHTEEGKEIEAEDKEEKKNTKVSEEKDIEVAEEKEIESKSSKNIKKTLDINKSKEFEDVKINDDTVGIRLKTCEQYNTLYVPFWSEDSKGLSINLIEMILANNPEENWDKGFEGEVEKLNKAKENGQTSGTIRSYTNGKYYVNYGKYTSYYVTVDEFKECLEDAKKENVKIGAYPATDYRSKLISFDLLRKIIASDPGSTFTGVKFEEWENNNMKSCKITQNSGTVYSVAPSTKDPEIN